MTVDLRPGALASALLLVVLFAFGVSVNVPKAAGGGFKGDEASYYVLANSLARDFDFQFDHRDLERVWEEYPTGPEGIFLKHGKSIALVASGRSPFVRVVKGEDPYHNTRLYVSKSYIYPLFAAPFVFVFGTNGFLVFHALLLSGDLFAAYLFLCARTKSNWAALPLAAAFLGASVVPAYFVWLTPELFNFSLALYALCLWGYKEVSGRDSRTADFGAAALLGLLTFSKPPYALMMFPVVAVMLRRTQWSRAVQAVLVWAVVAGTLCGVNAAVTGEFNYQGGDRKTFYHTTGFPFANAWETFENSGPVRGREGVMVGDVLVNEHSIDVFRHNLFYFVVGRYAGLLPYFFPGVLLTITFLTARQRGFWQWLVALTIAAAVLMLIVLLPFTYNGGGGPLGNRYFIAFYPLFLLLATAGSGLGAAVTAFAVGSAFTASVVLNPFFASSHPGEHATSTLFRFLPIELTLLHDLPVAQSPDRMKQPLNGTPPMLAYFMDDNAFVPEETPAGSHDYWFWIKGKSRADIVLRGAVDEVSPGMIVSKTITGLEVAVRNGGVANRIRISAGRQSVRIDLAPGEEQRFVLATPRGVPFHRDPGPTSYLYAISISATNGFVPFLDPPCGDRTPGACPSDPRFLGAMIRLVPEYTNADLSRATR